MSYARIDMHVLYSFGLICIHLYSVFSLYFVFYYVTLLYLKCSIVLRVRIKDDDEDIDIKGDVCADVPPGLIGSVVPMLWTFARLN